MELTDIRFDVVYVLKDFHLLDAESYQRTYSRHDGKPLNKGFYLVCWPPGSDSGKFGTETVFHGPFMRRRDAVTDMDRLRRFDCQTSEDTALPRRGHRHGPVAAPPQG